MTRQDEEKNAETHAGSAQAARSGRKAKNIIWGLFVMAEPVDVELYEALLDEPLEMPKTPLVCVYFFKVPLPGMYYPEASVGLRCGYQGEEAWHIVDLCVDQFLPWIGNYFLEGTWNRKFRAKELSMEQSGGKWRMKALQRDGNIWVNMEFTPQQIEQPLKPWQEDFLHRQKYIPNHHSKDNPLWSLKMEKRGRRVNRLDLDLLFPPVCEYKPGLVKVTSQSNHTWTRLLPTVLETPGLLINESHAKI